MRDHARRYRLRQVMYNLLSDLHEETGEPVAIGDLVHAIHSVLLDSGDGEMARQLVPEVFSGEVEEAFSNRLKNELLRYLHMFVIRELTISARQRMGLETWGLLKAIYHGVSVDDEDIQSTATSIGLSAQDLVHVLNSLLDHMRRKRLFFYGAEPIFTRFGTTGVKRSKRNTSTSFLLPLESRKKSQTLTSRIPTSWVSSAKKVKHMHTDTFGNCLVKQTMQNLLRSKHGTSLSRKGG